MAHLSTDEVAHYHREGYVIPQFRLSPARMDVLVKALDTLLANNPGVRPEKLVSAHVERAGTGADNGEGVRGVADFLHLAQDPDIVDMVASLIGDDVILWGAHVFCKPAAEGYETPWHQDGHYWPIRPLATCTVWVALEPSTAMFTPAALAAFVTTPAIFVHACTGHCRKDPMTSRERIFTICWPSATDSVTP